MLGRFPGNGNVVDDVGVDQRLKGTGSARGAGNRRSGRNSGASAPGNDENEARSAQRSVKNNYGNKKCREAFKRHQARSDVYEWAVVRWNLNHPARVMTRFGSYFFAISRKAGRLSP